MGEDDLLIVNAKWCCGIVLYWLQFDRMQQQVFELVSATMRLWYGRDSGVKVDDELQSKTLALVCLTNSTLLNARRVLTRLRDTPKMPHANV